ncbi:hypothetical protein GJAV_G00228220 [Gymnothorax javanicus]|nr:hypothetical protein GJAV_G00228220 [Gymnothorax javanicus]
MMKIVCLTFLLFAVIMHHTNAQPLAISSPKSCCFKFFEGSIPSGNVVSFEKIYSGCPHKGFIVTTIKGRSFCMGPNFKVETAAKD